MPKISYIRNNYPKLTQRIIYTTKQIHPIYPHIDREKSIIFEHKTGKILGEIITEPTNFTYFGEKFPAVKSLSIGKLRAFVRNKKVGTELVNFARIRSYEKGCEGRLHAISSDYYDETNPPHIFYRKYGFTSNETHKLEQIDSQILTGYPKYFTFEDIAMYYIPQKAGN